MDKRTLLGKREYVMKDGNSFQVKIYQKSNNRGLSIRVVYGEMEAYVSSRTTFTDLDKFVTKVYNTKRNCIVNRPFMKEDVYIYLLGDKKYFTNDPSKKNDSNFFYIPKNCKDPLTRYKKLFLEWITPRVKQIGQRMGKDLTDWKIRTGLFLSFYGVCFPVKHQMKFDYRLFAYKEEIIDSVIYHEISHIYEIHHNDRFYKIVKLYCPEYDRLNSYIDQGRFEGEVDHYVF